MLKQIAIISQSSALNASELAKGTAALQRQVSRDLILHWPIQATVDDFSTLADVPVGYWPIIIMDKINRPNLAGYHTDEHGQPFALIEYSSNWTLSVSHEMIEMLIDPFGKTLVPGSSVDPNNPGRVEYLVEACDPCQDPSNAYLVNGYYVSDFYTPRYFDPEVSQGVQYSANGKITKPREVLSGGYITWHNLNENVWYQAAYFGQLQIRNLGQIEMQGRSLREKIDGMAIKGQHVTLSDAVPSLAPGKASARLNKSASQARAARLKTCIASVLRVRPSSRRRKSP